MIVFLGFALGESLGIRQLGLCLAIAVAVGAGTGTLAAGGPSRLSAAAPARSAVR